MTDMKQAELAAQIRGDRPAPPADEFDEETLPYGVEAGANKFGFPTCPTCGRPPTAVGRQGFPALCFLFADALSASEYQISAMCQACQGDTFKDDAEEEEGEDEQPSPIVSTRGDDPSQLHGFINRVRSLYNINADKLPELSERDWTEFRDDPPRYFINKADQTQAEAIFREVEKRQKP